MSLPAIRAIASGYPEAEIVVLARPWVADLYARESAISRVLPYTPRPGMRDLALKFQAARALRAERFEMAISAAECIRSCGLRASGRNPPHHRLQPRRTRRAAEPFDPSSQARRNSASSALLLLRTPAPRRNHRRAPAR